MKRTNKMSEITDKVQRLQRTISNLKGIEMLLFSETPIVSIREWHKNNVKSLIDSETDNLLNSIDDCCTQLDALTTLYLDTFTGTYHTRKYLPSELIAVPQDKRTVNTGCNAIIDYAQFQAGRQTPLRREPALYCGHLLDVRDADTRDKSKESLGLDNQKDSLPLEDSEKPS